MQLNKVVGEKANYHLWADFGLSTWAYMPKKRKKSLSISPFQTYPPPVFPNSRYHPVAQARHLRVIQISPCLLTLAPFQFMARGPVHGIDKIYLKAIHFYPSVHFLPLSKVEVTTAVLQWPPGRSLFHSCHYIRQKFKVIFLKYKSNL